MMRTVGTLLFLLPAAALWAQQETLLVLLKGANALGYYSLDGKLQATVPVGQHPHEMVLSRDGKFAYITDNGTMRIENQGKGGNTVSVVDLAARKRVDTISTGKYRRPHGISLDPRRNYLAVTAESPDQLVIIDAERRKVIRTFAPRGATSHMVSFGPVVASGGAEYAFVSNSGAAYVSVVQLTTGAIKVIPTGDRPEGSLLSPNGKELYVANREANTITVIDTERQAAISEIRTGKGPVRMAVTPDGKTLVYALMHEHAIGFANLESRRETARLMVNGDPISMSMSPDGKLAFASAEEKDTVFVISVPERKLVRAFQTEKGAAPDPVMLVKLQ
ncbi:MAG: beta-propeller fold lactonase family protein [Bryobacteraceae bacterium]